MAENGRTVEPEISKLLESLIDVSPHNVTSWEDGKLLNLDDVWESVARAHAKSLERLCSSFLTCEPSARAEIRSFVAEHRRIGDLILIFAHSLPKRIRRPGHIPVLRLALAAISIENCGSDYRDTLSTLASLYVRAERAGIDPKPSFEAISAISTDTPTTGGCKSLAVILREIETYAVVRERRGN